MTGHYWMSFDSLRRSFENGFKTGHVRVHGTPIRTSLENAFRNWDRLVSENVTKQCSKMPSYPHSDVWVGDEGSELYMRFALAGYAPKNVNVKAAGNTIRIIAKSEDEPDVKFVHHGISTKNVDFTLSIDEDFNPRKAKVDFKEGMLTIAIPRSKGNEVIDLM